MTESQPRLPAVLGLIREGDLVDITGAQRVEVRIRRDGTVLWVNVDEQAVLRICQIDHLDLADERGAHGTEGREAFIDTACEIMHDAYEHAALAEGWDTNPASRKKWADVPAANQQTMRAAVAALLHWLDEI